MPSRIKWVFRHIWQSYGRLRTVRAFARRRRLSLAVILLDFGVERLLSRRLHSMLRRCIVRRERIRTERALRRTLGLGHGKVPLWERPKLSSHRFFLDDADALFWQVYQERFSESIPAVLADAEVICRHEFALLGTSSHSWPTPIDWHLDPKSGYRWPKHFYTSLYPVAGVQAGADVKLPYELSRMQHLPTLGKAYRLTRDERYACEAVAQLTQWFDENPCHVGVNWTCAMDVAIRIVNVLWGLAFLEGSAMLSATFKKRVFASVWEHGQYLVRHLEYRLCPDGTLVNHNHYLAGVVGLVYLGVLFPEFEAASIWHEIGVKALVEEMERQVFPDGMDYESSTSYHRLVLECFTSAALLCRLNNIPLPESFWARLERMYTFTLYITRPDGKVPQIGDADDGRLHILSEYGDWDRTDHRYLLSLGAVTFCRADMKAASGHLSEEAFWLLGMPSAVTFDALEPSLAPLDSTAFVESGIYVMRSAQGYLLACCNAVGTAGTGNHKHNDLLSLELCFGGTAFIVDPGSYVYTADPRWRDCFRSTKGHNTVIIDGQEQNRFTQGKLFRLMPDAIPIVHQWRSRVEDDWLEAEHTGYHRLAQPVSHRRMFSYEKRTFRVFIHDVLQGDLEHTVEWNWHFDHGVVVCKKDAFAFVAQKNGVTLCLRVTSESPLEIELGDGWVSRQYGIKLPSTTLKLRSVFSGYCRVSFEFYSK